MKNKAKQSLNLTPIFLFFILFIIFTPIPSIHLGDANCYPCQNEMICARCPKKGDFNWLPSIAQRIYGYFYPPRLIANKEIPTPGPTANLFNKEFNGWKTYMSKKIEFKYPNDWEIQPTQQFGSRSVNEFKFQNNPLFELSEIANYNQTLGKPYTTLDEYLDKRVNTSKDIILDGQPAKKIIDSEDPGHVVPYEELLVFSPDKKTILSLYFVPGFYSQTKANDAFDQILSTFKFVDQTPTPTCRPRPACLDATPRCMIPETSDMCPPSPTPTSTTFTCPANGWVDCMPIMTPEKQAACSTTAMAWYKVNCPNFQGGAM